ncbi:MAG: hypothetical protein PHY15_03785 [Eubacteriales bacterium]|nr:hypothetical protein [Eubacteriales bacterium]MDD4475824.1 hypothetical protein [Eubacteriales bacterium]
MKKVFAIILCLAMMFAITATVSAQTGYVTSGLVGRFSGSTFSGTTWTDLSGKGNDIDVTVDANSKFANGAYLNHSIKVNLPSAFLDVIKADEWTVEIQFGDIESVGTSWNTFLNSTNDAISVFRHVGNDNFVLKNVRADGENPRPVAALGLEDLKNTTIAITFKVGGDCIIYSDGVEIVKTAPTGALNAQDLYFGHDDPLKSHNTEYKSLRFYDRALTALEVAQNYNADNAEPSDESTDTSKSETSKAPQTSDNSSYAVVIAVIALLAGAVVVKKVRG